MVWIGYPNVEELLERYNSWSDFEVLENANRYPGPTGFFSLIAEGALWGSVGRVLPADVYRAHESGLIYVHKLPYSMYLPYCTGHSLRTLLRRGLSTPTVSSRPARHFDTFVDHVANFLITMQHYFTGAQALSLVEWFAGPFVRSDGLGPREVRQNVQRLLFNLNYPTRIALQTPFTNFTMPMDAPRRTLDSESAILAGSPSGVLGDYEREAKLFVKALCEVLSEGDASGRPFTFPIPTLMTTASWIWEDPEVHELVFGTASRRGSFYWLNTRVLDPDATYAMCCRLSIDTRGLLHALGSGSGLAARADLEQAREEYLRSVVRLKFGGVWAIPDSTGSVNVVDVNLPRLVLEARRDDARFWELYTSALSLARLALNWFRARYARLVESFGEVYSVVLAYLPAFPSTHFSTVGLVGLPEAAALMLGDPKLWFEGSRSSWLEAADLMRRIVEFAASRTREWMLGEGVPWNVEEVPGESAAVRLAINDLRRFPELAECLPREPLYSTSIAPYYASMDLADRVEVEQRVQKYFTGGVMMHVFLGEEPDPEALASLTRKLTQTELVYWSYTPALTYCPRCDRTFTGLYSSCPRCGGAGVETWSRVVGYYRPLRNWNPYRRSEFWSRRHYSLRP